MENNWLTVMESDWSEGGDESRVHGSKGMVGPVYTYREILKPLLGLFDVGLDHAFFDAPKGLEALLSRFDSHRQRNVLCITAHGSPTRLSTSGGSIPIWDMLLDIQKEKEGVLLASCKLGARRQHIQNVLENGNFNWIATYREDSSYLSAVQTEITFWKCYFSGWGYYKIESGSRARRVPLTLDGKPGGKPLEGNAMASAIATYLLHPASVALRFDVRELNKDDEVISSLEVFNTLITEMDLANKLQKVASKEPSKTESKKYRHLVESIWNNQWEWWPAD